MSLGFLFVHQIFSQLISPENASNPACSHKPNRPHLSCWSCGHTSLTPAAQKHLRFKAHWRHSLTCSGSTACKRRLTTALKQLSNKIVTTLEICTYRGTRTPCATRSDFRIASAPRSGNCSRISRT